MTVAPQPRPRQCSKDLCVLPNSYYYRMEPKNYVYMSNIRLAMVIACIGNYIVAGTPTCSQIMDQTNRSITQTNTHSTIQSLHLLPNIYYYMMDPNNYVYRPNNKLVMVIT